MGGAVIIVPHTPPPASARSRALADALKVTIAEFQRREPKLSEAEIEAALARAHDTSGARDARRRRAIVGVAAGLAAGLGALIVAMTQGTSGARPPLTVLVTGGVVLVGAIVALLLRMINNP